VQYVEESFPFPKSTVQAFMWKLLSTKSEARKSEKEGRVFLRPEDGIGNQSAGRVLCFADFASELTAREVILRVANKNTLDEVHAEMQGYPESVQVARMGLSCNLRELQKVQVKKRWGEFESVHLVCGCAGFPSSFLMDC
jgi:hypothetical protein